MLSASEIKDKKFSKKLRGYDVDEVDKFLSDVTFLINTLKNDLVSVKNDLRNKELEVEEIQNSFNELREKAEEVQEAIDKQDKEYEELIKKNKELMEENMRLKKENSRLQEEKDSYKENEESIKDTLLIANKVSDELKREAESTAKAIIEESKKEANAIIENAKMAAEEIISQSENKTIKFKEKINLIESKMKELKNDYLNLMNTYISSFEKDIEDISSNIFYISKLSNEEDDINDTIDSKSTEDSSDDYLD